MTCWDCKAETDDYVIETRQVSGGAGMVFEGDFQPVQVCASRRICASNKQAADEATWGKVFPEHPLRG